MGRIIKKEGERIPKTVLNGKFHNKMPVGKTKNKIGGRRSEGLIADPRNKKMEGATEDREEWRRLLREAMTQKGP